MEIIALDRIRAVLPSIDLVAEIADGFVAYSDGRAVVPPVGELILDDPPGDVHIKYGYIRGDDCYVIKIASGFYGNPALGLPSSNGMMLVFEQATGRPSTILLDDGHLTDVRTAVAGAIAASYLAAPAVNRIGIVGTGMQAELQLRQLAGVRPCRDVVVWGRNPVKARRYVERLEGSGFDIAIADTTAEILDTCDLIVTTTPATSPLLSGRARPGTHITAVGSDTADKQELDSGLLAQADVLVADSIAQCRERGEIHSALAAGVIGESKAVELGDVIAGRRPGRTSADQVSVADLTGVAVQDIRIARAVLARVGAERGPAPGGP